MVSEDLEALVIGKTFRVPAPAGPAGNGEAAARQFDVALMSAGFKCSGALLEHLSGLDSAVVTGTAVRVLATVRRLAGDHVQHITDLMAAKAGRVTAYEPGCVLGEDPVTFVGLEQPEGLPYGSEVFTLNRLRELVPA